MIFKLQISIYLGYIYTLIYLKSHEIIIDIILSFAWHYSVKSSDDVIRISAQISPEDI